MYYLLFIAFRWILFRSIPGTIPVSIPEWLHSVGINGSRNSIPPDSAGFQQECMGQGKDLMWSVECGVLSMTVPYLENPQEESVPGYSSTVTVTKYLVHLEFVVCNIHLDPSTPESTQPLLLKRKPPSDDDNNL
jgi:hypothetical protein